MIENSIQHKRSCLDTEGNKFTIHANANIKTCNWKEILHTDFPDRYNELMFCNTDRYIDWKDEYIACELQKKVYMKIQNLKAFRKEAVILGKSLDDTQKNCMIL